MQSLNHERQIQWGYMTFLVGRGGGGGYLMVFTYLSIHNTLHFISYELWFVYNEMFSVGSTNNEQNEESKPIIIIIKSFGKIKNTNTAHAEIILRK